ncbi:MAG: GNAT family N-acetyltransferase [Bacillota bacterium]|nr:GNAT family N-acetyltransferase [Bacillota bacterium]
MIKKLKEENKRELLEFVNKEKEINLFIIGDIENYGLEADFLDFYGEYENEKLTAVLLRFYDSFIVYGEKEFNGKNFSDIILSAKPKMISGEEKSIRQIGKYIELREKRDTYFSSLDNKASLYKGPLLDIVEETKFSEVEQVLVLQNDRIAEFTNTMPLKTVMRKYKDGTGRGFHIKNSSGMIVSSAETGAENKGSAMVLGVCSDPDYRGRGYASAIVSKLCDTLLSEGKSPCLFYDNPKAGKIYKSLGFNDIGIWSMCKL